MSLRSKTREWAAPLVGGLLLAGVFILGMRTTGWVSWLACGIGIAAFLAMFAYGLACEVSAWPAIEDELDQRDEEERKAGGS